MPFELSGGKDDMPANDWHEFVDNDTGRKYYHNAVLDQTLWKKPLMPIKYKEATAKAIAAAMPEHRPVEEVEPEEVCGGSGRLWCPACLEEVTGAWSAHCTSTTHQFSITSRAAPVKSYGLGPSNKGYQMLKRKGWSENEGLGAQNQGRLDPVPTQLKRARAGIGGEAKQPRVTHYSSANGAAEIKAVAKAQEKHRGRPGLIEAGDCPGNMSKSDRLKLQEAARKKEDIIRSELYSEGITGDLDDGAYGNGSPEYGGDPDFGGLSDGEEGGHDPCP
jgi:hypothetical protein